MGKKLERKCSVCGKNIEAKVDDSGKIYGGYYYGKIELPFGRGKYVKVGTSRLFGMRADVVEWTGKTRKVEYWECNRCYMG
jgi:hypothetical protein